MTRRVLALAALAGLVVLSGCAGFLGGGGVSDQRLDEPPAEPYVWDADVDAHITVTGNSTFRAVYRTNRSEIELYRRDGFGGRNALPVSALRYRYPNGTVITGSELSAHGGGVSRTREAVTVTLPTDDRENATGQLAFTSESTPKRFALPTFVTGSYEVVLPENRRVAVPLFGRVSPSGYVTTRGPEGHTHIRWAGVESEAVVVRYYLQRDLYIFGAIAAALVLVGGGGVLYYRRKIEALRRRREEMGLNVDVDDDLGDDGPPRMR